MDKELKGEMKKSAKSLLSLLIVGGLVLVPVTKGFLKAIDPERNKVIQYYDSNGNFRIDKEEKEAMLEDLGYDIKKNYRLKKEDFEILYGKIK